MGGGGGWGLGSRGGQVGWEQRSEACAKIQKKIGGGGEEGGFEWRSEAFVKIKKNVVFFWGGGSGQGGSGQGGSGQGGWLWRIEAFVKMKKKNEGGGGGLG